MCKNEIIKTALDCYYDSLSDSLSGIERFEYKNKTADKEHLQLLKSDLIEKMKEVNRVISELDT